MSNPDDFVNAYKVTRPEFSPSFCIFRTWSDIEDEFDGAETGDVITIELVRMRRSDLDALPDFPGW